ncbi:uncharacterized protein LOC124614040 [Schistocerca americana]|uniref:uncharacterized protein LOC124614040 n=1 Tax=Schistocerca americana TaxID=7009 RepID=UPI001F4FF8D5|nr:uncharacterized protein LOC124614040 [Schistocerca americana]
MQSLAKGVCPFSGEAAEDEPMSAKYQKPPDHSNSEPFKEGRRNKVHPDIEIHTEEEINHPVLGKMKLVTIPVPNTHTGEDFTKGYMLFNDEESPEEREELDWQSGTGESPENDGGKQNEDFSSFATEPLDKEVLHMRGSPRGGMSS